MQYFFTFSENVNPFRTPKRPLFETGVLGSLVMVKASRLGKCLQMPPARSTSVKTKAVWPMRKKIKKAIPVRYHDGLPQLRPNAGGIDVGASEVWLDVGNKDAEPTRRFETFTADLNRMGDWLKSCGIETVAMEST